MREWRGGRERKAAPLRHEWGGGGGALNDPDDVDLTDSDCTRWGPLWLWVPPCLSHPQRGGEHLLIAPVNGKTLVYTY